MMNLLWDNLFKKEDATQRTISVLSQSKLFSRLTKRELRVVEDLVHERHYRMSEAIFKQGEIGIGMYIIARGSVEITVVEPDGETSVITNLKRGDFFGELSLVEENGKRTANAIATEDSVLIGFFKPDLAAILQTAPAIGAKITTNLAEVLGRRLKLTTDKISQLRREMSTLSGLSKADEKS